jgi:hypothetical protein
VIIDQRLDEQASLLRTDGRLEPVPGRDVPPQRSPEEQAMAQQPEARAGVV